ncbi:unnamed protein product [Prorocentrum cordatum]|uniref:Uncharacterized protein n=1 Tax=Prorocentrum cordatum TaxID=2364126 RepID=A0ABN9Q4R6_9DINO|nr:unnamed protein product [Polarella glacialis]
MGLLCEAFRNGMKLFPLMRWMQEKPPRTTDAEALLEWCLAGAVAGDRGEAGRQRGDVAYVTGPVPWLKQLRVISDSADSPDAKAWPGPRGTRKKYYVTADPAAGIRELAAAAREKWPEGPPVALNSAEEILSFQVALIDVSKCGVCSRGVQVPAVDAEHVEAARQSLETRAHQILRLVVDALLLEAGPNPDKAFRQKVRALRMLMTHFGKGKGVKWFGERWSAHVVTGMAFRALERLRMEPALEGAADAVRQSLVAFGAM